MRLSDMTLINLTLDNATGYIAPNANGCRERE